MKGSYKQYKKARKAAIELRGCKEGEYNVYNVTCPFCHTRMRGDFHATLMFSCWECDNPIDLRGDNGRQHYDAASNVI